MSGIHIETTKNSRINAVDFNNIPFGRIFADHMVEIDYNNGAWQAPKIIPYQNLSLSPALSCMHYGQAIFEGMKANKTPNGEIILFRARDNAERLNQSAMRLAMPQIPVDTFLSTLKEWLKLDSAWIPEKDNTAFYIRPFMIATDTFLGVKPSDNYKFIMYGCPVGAYYTKNLRIKVELNYVRAAAGGVGYVKAAGNYAASLYPASLVQKEGYDQLLWTDALEHKYVEELGTSNFFAIIDEALYTPQLDGTILEGITRDSVIQLAKNLGMKVHEQALSLEFLSDSYKKGLFTEAFATGTAATIAPIELLQYQEETMKFITGNGSVAQKLGNTLNNIKIGKEEDPFNWIILI
ncbi:MAG: branched-chain amino acid aminotransferase [Bacteroidia bacterium]|jgi:branched-chain amino acid aminotransferase